MHNPFSAFTFNEYLVWVFLSESARYWEENIQISRRLNAWSELSTVKLVFVSEKHVLSFPPYYLPYVY